MDFDDLKKSWQTSPAEEPAPDALLAKIRQRNRDFEREVHKRTWFGAASFLLPVPLTFFIFMIAPGNGWWLPVVEWTTITFLCTCATLIIAHGMKRGKPAAFAESLRDFVDIRLAQVERQARLFRTLKWWFWASMLCGWLVYTGLLLAGALRQNLFSIAIVFIVPATAYCGIRASRRYVKREILPWQHEFAALLQDMSEG